MYECTDLQHLTDLKLPYSRVAILRTPWRSLIWHLKYHPTYAYICQVIYTFIFSDQNILYISHHSHSSHMHGQFHTHTHTFNWSWQHI